MCIQQPSIEIKNIWKHGVFVHLSYFQAKPHNIANKLKIGYHGDFLIWKQYLDKHKSGQKQCANEKHLPKQWFCYDVNIMSIW